MSTMEAIIIFGIDLVRFYLRFTL